MLEIYGIKIKIPESVYEPDEDMFLLISALDAPDLKGKACLEIGCGSGLIALFLAKNAKSVLAVDINPAAVACAKENAAQNCIKNTEFLESNLFSKVKEKFDIIAFNPPYLPEEPQYKDIALDGGKDGRRTIRRFLVAAPKFLRRGGRIFILESSLSKYAKTLEHFKKSGFCSEVVARRKLDWEELVVIRASRT